MNRDEPINTTWLYGGALLLVLIVASGGLYLSLSSYFSHGELGTKRYYAVLQAVELDNLSNRSAKPILKKNVNGSGLNILGLPGGDVSHTRVWIILNQVSPEGQPLVMPLGVPVEVDCNFVTNFIKEQPVIDLVRQYLLKNCTHR